MKCSAIFAIYDNVESDLEILHTISIEGGRLKAPGRGAAGFYNTSVLYLFHSLKYDVRLNCVCFVHVFHTYR